MKGNTDTKPIRGIESYNQNPAKPDPVTQQFSCHNFKKLTYILI